MSADPIYETSPLPEPEEIDARDPSDYFSETFHSTFLSPPVDPVRGAAYYPGYSFQLSLKFCSACVRYLVNNFSAIDQGDGHMLLQYYMCPECIEENKLKMSKW
jgi:hypothetical protein